jgi:hypothetical protein
MSINSDNPNKSVKGVVRRGSFLSENSAPPRAVLNATQHCTPWRAVGAANLQPADDGDHFQEMAEPIELGHRELWINASGE